MELSPLYVMQGRRPPSIFSTKKNKAASGDVERWIDTSASASSMYYSMA